MTFVLHTGDCLAVLPALDAESADAIVTDPPAGIGFMGQEWDKDKGGRETWIAWMTDVAAACLRVLKPGGHALVWSLPRTSHWTAMAWEDAGFVPRDRIAFVFGSGFPKSQNLSKAFDKQAGVLAHEGRDMRDKSAVGSAYYKPTTPSSQYTPPLPKTDAARVWQGWGTALKPAIEDWWLFRKPLKKKTVAKNVEVYKTGAINIDGCRVPCDSELLRIGSGNMGYEGSKTPRCSTEQHPEGRWPANVCHDGSEEIEECFGHASRFFYGAKASKTDRNDGLEEADDVTCAGVGALRDGDRSPRPRKNPHPTAKNTALMRYLCRLITPPGGVILDPFFGSGSTGKAAVLEGFGVIGIEQEPVYAEIARRRVEAALRKKAAS